MDKGIVTPFKVNPDWRLIEKLTEDTINYLNTDEGKQVLLQNGDSREFVHRDKLPRDVHRLLRVHLICLVGWR